MKNSLKKELKIEGMICLKVFHLRTDAILCSTLSDVTSTMSAIMVRRRRLWELNPQTLYIIRCAQQQLKLLHVGCENTELYLPTASGIKNDTVANTDTCQCKQD